MTFKAELRFSDSKFVYQVLECEYEFTQDIDITGKPCSKPRLGIINALVESMSDAALVQWMLAPTNVRSGEITFYKDMSNNAKLKSLKFKEAICIRVREKFTHDGQSPMLTNISFVAKEIEVDDVSYSALWTQF